MLYNFKLYLNGLVKYLPLLRQLVIRDIKVRYRKSFLGMLWTILNPLLMMGVMTAVFSTLFKSNIPNFPVYFLTGNLIFSFNSEATNQAMTSIIANASLIKKIYVPKYLFPISKVFSCLVNFFFSFIALLIVMLITDAQFFPTLWLSFIPIFYLFLFVSGLSLILSAITVFFRDIGHFYSVLILAWNYFTPVFYPIDILPKSIQNFMIFNPMYQYINYLRFLIRDGVIPNIQTNLICFSTSICILILGFTIFKKTQDKFILYI